MRPRLRMMRATAAAILLVGGAGVAVARGMGPISAEAEPPRRHVAVADDPVTVRVEVRDVYQTLRLEGVVEPRPAHALAAPVSGRFTPARMLQAGTRVERGAVLGVVRACSATTTGATTSSGDAASAPGAGDTGTPSCTGRATQVTAPATGRLSADLVRRDVARGDSLGEIDPGGFHARLPVTDPSALYAFTTPPKQGRGEIVGGPSGFEVRYERLMFDRDAGRVDVYGALPRGLRVFAGLRVVVVFVINRTDDVPTLPRSAVRGDRARGQVVVVEAGGRRSVRDIELGAADARVVEVKGLRPGTEVVEFPLESDFVR